MITLYDKSEISFEHNGIGSLEQDIIDPKIHWIDNGVFSFEFEYPLFAKHGLEITNSSIIKARDPEQDNLFFVYKVIPSMGYIKVYCYHIFYKLAFNTINDTNIVGKNGQGALTQLSGATQYPHKFQLTSDLTISANSRVVRKNPVEILLDSNLDNSFINRWGGHIIRHGFNISMNQSYGSNKGYKIQHKKDLMGYKATIDETTVVTRIRPVGYDGLLLPEIYVDSPLINHYPEPRIQEYAYSDVKVGKGEGEFATADLAYAELRRLAKLEFSKNKIDLPRGIYKVDFVNLKETEEYKNFAPLKQILPGDVVAVEHEEDGINISSQMVEYNWDPLLKEYIDLTLGNYERSFSATVNKIDKIQTDIKNINTQIELVYFSANGKNKTYTGVTEPVIDQNSTEGDLWFKKNDDKTEMWILRNINGVLQWVVELSDATQEELKAEVGNAIEQADEDRIKAKQDINQALLDAKSYTETKAQEFDNQLLIVNQNVTTVKNSANAAVLKADKAIEDVGFLKPDVATAKANAATAIQDAATATQNATTAIQNAQTALNSVTTLSQEVDVSITNINGELTRKISQTTFNTLSGTVGTHTTQINQTQNALLTKAESSLVNTIKGTVDTHTTQIKVASDGLELKADSSLVNTVKETVDSHSSLISANAQAINARMTSTQIESLLTGKQYVNQATFAATSTSITAQITQVSNDLSNFEIGGRNYFGKTTVISSIVNNLTTRIRDVTTPNGFYVTGNSTASGHLRLNKVITGNGWWTVSFDIKGSQSTPVGMNVQICDLGNTVVRTNSINTYTRISVTVNVTNYSEDVYNFVDFEKFSYAYIWVDNIKVEKGNRASDYTDAPEDMATLEKVVTIEANIDGINTLVASKASQTQVTQLAGQITTKVESSTYNSKMTQLDNAINLRVVQSDVTTAILADKTIKDTRSDNQLPSWYNSAYPKQTVEEFKYRTTMGVAGTATYGKLETKVIWNSTSGGAITQIFSSSDGVFKRVSNANYTAWLAWDKVAEAGQLINQINISTEGILLQGKRIQLDGDVTMTAAFVTRLDALTLTAVYADIATLKTKVLTANVITADMLQTNVSIINKLFATDTMVTTLTAKTSFINSVKAIDIAADRITTGNLNAANVNIINLNVSKIVGLNSSFIQSNWNAAVGGGVSIAGGGVVTTASSGAQTLLQNGVLYVKSTAGQGLGTIGAALDGNENLFSIDIVNNQSFTIRYQTATGSTIYKDIIGYYDYLGTVVINNATQINGWLRMNGALDMQQSDILAARYITAGVLQTGTIGSILNDGNRIAVKGISGVSLGVGGQVNGGFARIFWLDGTTIYAEKNLSMQKNTITNQSDKRLKKNIVTSARNAMDSMRNWNFVDYEWLDNEENKGVQFGLIAQDTPELMTYGEEHDFYSLDTSRQIMLNSKVGQELVFRTDKHEAKFTELEGKYELLKQKVEKLESE